MILKFQQHVELLKLYIRELSNTMKDKIIFLYKPYRAANSSDNRYFSISLMLTASIFSTYILLDGFKLVLKYPLNLTISGNHLSVNNFSRSLSVYLNNIKIK